MKFKFLSYTVILFVASTISGLLSNVVSGYLLPAFDGKEYIAIGGFLLVLIIGLLVTWRLENPLVSKITSIIPSPYICGHPVEPVNFFGRKREIQKFFHILGSAQIQSLNILGLRRSGKTSFLKYVSSFEVMKQYLQKHDEYLFIYVDLQNNVTSRSSFYQSIIPFVYQASKKIPPPKASSEFTFEDVRNALNQVNNYKIAILLDEFDALFKYPDFNQAFFEGLRSLVVGRKLAWITASYRDLYDLGKLVGLSAGSPFYNIFNSRIHLGGMVSEDSEELIRVPAESVGKPFSMQDTTWILENAGTLPAFIQKTAASLFEAHLHTEDRNSALSLAKQDLKKWAFNHYENYWEKFSTEEKNALIRLAKNKTKENKSGLMYLEDLERYGVVLQKEGCYRINGSVFNEWIKMHS